MSSLAYETNTMKAWVQRREEAHKGWTQDELWKRIKHNWPTLSDEDQERVFQGAYVAKRD